jgi:hypothetical protein
MAQKAELRGKINLDSTGFQRGIAKAKMSVKGFARSMRQSLSGLPGMFAGVLGVNAVKGMIELGASAEETASKFRAVFKTATAEMNKEVERLLKNIPATKAEMQNALATFAAMGNAFGLNAEAANMFSVQMVEIAGDLASFHDLKIDDMFTKIRSAISGEFEPMKQLGIVINEARLKQEALNLGLSDGTKQLSAAQKALAVQSIMIRDMGDANGDAALTADSAANRIKFMKAQIEETATNIGTQLIPAMTGFLEFVTGGITALENFGTKLGEVFFMGGKTKEEFQAMAELESEGAFDGKSKRGSVREDMIKKRMQEIKDRIKAHEKERQAVIDRLKAESEGRNNELKQAKDLQSALEKQIETETDPKRKKALEDRLAASEALLKAAGDLSTMQPPELGANGNGNGGAKNGADTNQSGYVTPREQRAFERKKRQEEREQRRKERAERIAESGVEASDKRRQAAGEKAKPEQGVKTLEEFAKTTADNTKTIAEEITKNP